MRSLNKRRIYYFLLFALLSIIVMELLIAVYIEKPKLAREAEKSGQRAVFNIIDQKLLTPLIASEKENIDNIAKANKPTNLAPNKKTRIAVLIRNLGMNSASTSAAMELPNKFNLGFSPYSINLETIIAQAKAKNFDILLNLPMEPTNYPADDLGPKALMTDLPLAENLRRLNSIITLSGNDAIYSDEDEKFTHSVEGVKNLVKVISTLKKHFVYGVGLSNNLLFQAVEDDNFPILVRDLTIDDKLSAEVIDHNLKQLELMASKKGLAIAYANSYPLTINKLKEWYLTLGSKNIELVKISELKDISANTYKQLNEAD